MKDRIKQKIKLRLKIAGFILSLAGWFMLFVAPLEFMGFDFSKLSNLIETAAFSLGLKLTVIVVLIVLIKKQDAVNKLIEKYA